MSVETQFSQYANDYNNFNIIQQIAAKALVRDINNKPKNILEVGCGSGQIFKYIDWQFDSYTAIDFSKSMCELHPKEKNLEVFCYDFDSKEFFDFLDGKKFDNVVSSSAMQWSKDLSKLVKKLSETTNKIDAVLFTSNTFKTIQQLTNKNSPILTLSEIKDSFSKYFKCEFEVFSYNLEFDNKKDLFDYIKKSGVSGGSSSLDFKSAKKLYKEYTLNYLEFEVIFVKTISKL
ncbi:methyltransferase [Campylobacterota bacterium DY0563]|uniref:methyltransferase n=1 Tax=Halarcobacter sp. TaxID=2321133 RepID=UPI002AA6BAA7|nr:methyltransferase [Halarcobacter sp.]